MTKFIALTLDYGGASIIVDFNHIVAIVSSENDKGTTLVLTCDTYYVQESSIQIMHLIKEAMEKSTS